MQYASTATCGCRIIEGSGLHHCCPHLDAKAQRLAGRAMLIQAARDAADSAASSPKKADQLKAAQLRQHADALERLNRDVRQAEMAAAVYERSASDPAHLRSGHGGAPEGMVRLNADEYKHLIPEALQKAKWNDLDSGFHAEMYYDELYGTYDVTFRGTEAVSLKDWKTNHDQAHGLETQQYNQAMDIGKAIKASKGDKRYADWDIQTTGHSLGAGLGTAGGTVAGVPYTGFNGAGVHPRTVPRYTDGKVSNADGAHLGRAYQMANDPLNKAQTPQGSRAIYDGVGKASSALKFSGGVLSVMLGNTMAQYAQWSKQQTGGQLPGSPAGAQHTLSTVPDKTGLADGHSIFTVLDAIESEKREHQFVLNRLLAPDHGGLSLGDVP